ncbi:MAG: hypothetical protein ACLT98_16760 [Eggerthellaceae bacterium]
MRGRAEDPTCSSASDLSLLDAVCSFANGFASTSALSEFSMASEAGARRR